MAQHLWSSGLSVRVCEVCLAHQFAMGREWAPAVSSICPRDSDDDGRRITRRRPIAPSGAPRIMVLEDA